MSEEDRRHGLRLQVGVGAGKENRNWEVRGQMHYQYFFDVSEDEVQHCRATKYHLGPTNGRSALGSIMEFWERGENSGGKWNIGEWKCGLERGYKERFVLGSAYIGVREP